MTHDKPELLPVTCEEFGKLHSFFCCIKDAQGGVSVLNPHRIFVLNEMGFNHRFENGDHVVTDHSGVEYRHTNLMCLIEGKLRAALTQPRPVDDAAENFAENGMTWAEMESVIKGTDAPTFDDHAYAPQPLDAPEPIKQNYAPSQVDAGALEALDRLNEYIRQLKPMRGIDKEVVHQVHSDTNRPPAQLRVSDIKIIIASLANQQGKDAMIKITEQCAREIVAELNDKDVLIEKLRGANNAAILAVEKLHKQYHSVDTLNALEALRDTALQPAPAVEVGEVFAEIEKAVRNALEKLKGEKND